MPSGVDKPCIALVANATWNIYNFRLALIDALLSSGWKVVVVAPVDEFMKYRDAYPSIEHYNLRHLVRDGINPLRDGLLAWELVGLYKKICPDIVMHFTHKPNIFGGLACYLTGLPSIAVLTGLGYPFIQKGWLQSVIKRLYAWSARFHTLLVFENQDDKIYFQQEGLARGEKMVSVRGCGVNTRYYTPQITDSERTGCNFLFLGRLLYDKGIKEYVEAAQIIVQKHHDIRFLVAGELDPHNPSTVSRADLHTWIQSGAIDYLGNLQDVRKAIGSSDCVVLPSYREAIPRSLTEAMAMAKPVITTDTAGCREAVQEGVNGLLVPVGNVRALADAMLRFASFPRATWIKMGQAGRLKTETELDDCLIARQLTDIINQARGSHQNDSPA